MITTRRLLHLLGYNERQACKKLYISSKNKKKIMEWAKVIRKKNLVYWKMAVFIDESKIKISGSDCVAKVNRGMAAFLQNWFS